MKFKYIFLFTILFCTFLKAQRSFDHDQNYEDHKKPLDSAENKIFLKLFSEKRSQDYIKEKVYAQTDHVFYQPGNSVYFKAYIVDAQNNLPADWSKVLFAELYDPSGKKIEDLKFSIENGATVGNFNLPEKANGGIYKIRLFTNWMNNENNKNFFEKEITVQKTSSPRILMKLDFPKKGLNGGDEVLADLSLRNLQNLPIPFYEGQFEVMIEGKEFLQNTFITDKEGKVQIKFLLPKNLVSSDVLLNIKLNYNAFQESISRSIPVTINKIDVLFFSEGGSLANDVKSNIAYKALNEFLQPVDIKAEIVDDKGRTILNTETVKFGMGKFSFSPIKNEKFFLKITSHRNSSLFELPKGTDENVVLNIEKKSRQIVLKIRSKTNQKLIVEASFRGKVLETKKDISPNSEIYFDENIFPSGIARFTIFDVNKNPLAERVIFVNKNKNLQISIKPDKTEYIPREKVVFDIETQDINGKPISTNLSLSVLDDKLFSYADDRQDHIISWLQMDSELKGKIEEPPFYFKIEEAKADEALDLVMLTNGYRYFELLPEIRQNGVFSFQKEEQNSIYGKIVDVNGKDAEAEVFLLNNNTNEILKQNTKNGRFYFKNFKYDRDYQLIARSKKPKEKVDIKILTTKISSDLITQKIRSGKTGKDFDVVVNNPISEEFNIKKTPENKNDPSQNINRNVNTRKGRLITDSTKTSSIEEIIVVGYGIKKAELRSSSNTVVREVTNNNNLPNLLQGKALGVIATKNSGVPGNAETILIRGFSNITSGNSPLIVVDGIFTDLATYTLNTDNINNITVLKDAAATAIYGSKGSNGVVIITSKKPNYLQKNINFGEKIYFAYKSLSDYNFGDTTYARVFQYPNYSNSPNSNYRTDFRETIYWNPIVQTNKNGKAKVEFYNSDANTTFRAIAEGISTNGLLGRTEKTYSSQSKLQIDAKIPTYLTQGDEPKIAVIFRNNSDIRKTIDFKKILPNNIKSGSSDSLIVLNSKESGKIMLPLSANKIVRSDIQLIAETNTELERQILPIQIGPKGFRHYFEHVVSKDSTISFQIPDHLDESLTYDIQVFKDTASQLLNDVDRLKEKPHGCFEQTSSVTYPNYFVLKYLQSKGKIDSKESIKAIKLLKDGYEKLVNFETKEKGFSLFGRSPASITLSAYGLMEFNDLKTVINVNRSLIDRTSKFILSKRDGKGNFILNDHKNEDSTTKNKYYWSQQGYILYALAETGMKDEIMKEYDHLYQINQYSDDLYLLSLMANVAFQLNKIKDYEFLIKRMTIKLNENKIEAETNFMKGRGNDIQKEALSLFVLAVMRSPNYDQQLATKIIGKIEISDDHKYESTQTLVMRLKAITEFYKTQPNKVKNAEPMIFINDNLIKDPSDRSKFLKKGNNEFRVKYPEKNGSPVLLSGSFNDLIPEKNPFPEIFFTTTLDKNIVKIGDNVRMNIKIENPTNINFGMITAKIGIPAGTTMDPINLKAMIEKKEIAYYEIFDNYLVLYWYELDSKKTLQVHLDAKAEFPGKYTGKANHVFEYYNQRNYQWTDGLMLDISE